NISGTVSQQADTVINANILAINSRGLVTLLNGNEINDLGGVIYGGDVSIKSLGGLRLTGDIDRYSSGVSHRVVTLLTEGTDAVLNLNGRNIYGSAVYLSGQGVRSNGGTVNGGAGNIIINAGGGVIDLAGATLTTASTANTA